MYCFFAWLGINFSLIGIAYLFFLSISNPQLFEEELLFIVLKKIDIKKKTRS